MDLYYALEAAGEANLEQGNFFPRESIKLIKPESQYGIRKVTYKAAGVSISCDGEDEGADPTCTIDIK